MRQGKGAERMIQRVIDTPVGRLLLAVQAGELCRIRLAGDHECTADEDALLDETQRQLAQYFAGARQTFALPLHMEGSAFDCRVWQMLQEIPFGEIRTYGQLAAAIGSSGASRAAGGACARNPLLIVVPCHRVVAGTGKLTGFAAGLAVKQALLAHEGWKIEREIIRQK